LRLVDSWFFVEEMRSVSSLSLACLYGAILTAWMKFIFLAPLAGEAADMVRESSL
jgi:hypothetical protein